MSILGSVRNAFRRWRTVLARELLREDDVLIFHREGDPPRGLGRGEPRVAE